MIKVYIAGLYSRNKQGGEANIIEIFENIRVGKEMGSRLFELGYAPYVPWFDYHFILHAQQSEKLTADYFKNVSLEWLKVCDVIYMLPHWEYSGGARAEKELAEKLGIPVVYTVDELEKLKEVLA